MSHDDHVSSERDLASSSFWEKHNISYLLMYGLLGILAVFMQLLMPSPLTAFQRIARLLLAIVATIGAASVVPNFKPIIQDHRLITATLIVVVIISAIFAVGGNLSDIFSTVASSLQGGRP